jgi:hypothetical protein
MTNAYHAYLLADKAVQHWTLILAGSLSATQRQRARIELIRAVGRRVRAKADMEQEPTEQVAA